MRLQDDFCAELGTGRLENETETIQPRLEPRLFA